MNDPYRNPVSPNTSYEVEILQNKIKELEISNFSLQEKINNLQNNSFEIEKTNKELFTSLYMKDVKISPILKKLQSAWKMDYFDNLATLTKELTNIDTTSTDVDPFKIAGSLGIIVKYESINSFGTFDRSKNLIVLNHSINNKSNRFTLSFLLGHAIMDESICYFDLDSTINLQSESTDKKTKRSKMAGEFACDLLCPVELVVQYVMIKGITSEIIANRFNVSINIINYQISRC